MINHQQPPQSYVQQMPPNNYPRNSNQNFGYNDNQMRPALMQNQPMVQQNYPPPNVSNYNTPYPNSAQFINQDPAYPNQNYNQYPFDNQYINNPNVPFQPNSQSMYNNQHGYKQNIPQQNFQQHRYNDMNNDNYNNRKFQNEGNRGGIDSGRGGRRGMQNFNVKRSPGKRRENTQVLDSPKKKKRSTETGNLHEITTVDMPDSTFKEVSISIVY